MGKRIDSISFDHVYHPDILDSCIHLEFNNELKLGDDYEHPYKHEVLTFAREGKAIPDTIEIIGIEDLYKVIDEEDCLPDYGLYDYKNEELELDLEDRSIREIYKAVLDKMFNK